MSPCRILIVEDEIIIAMDIQEQVAAMGFQPVGIAASGEQALQALRELSPDLVLLDIRLKGDMDGVAVAEEIHRERRTPVIFLTAYSDEQTLERAKRTEPYGYILKPSHERELKSTIEVALYKHRADEEFLRLNRLYDTLSQVNQAIVRVRSREEMFQAVCRIVVERGGADLAWIGWLDPATHRIDAVARFGKSAALLEEAAYFADGRPEGQGNVGQAIRQGKPCVCNGCGTQGCPYPAAMAPVQFGFCSCASFPLRFQGQVCGTLTLAVNQAGFFQKREFDLLEEVALDVSFALDKLAGDARREQAEASLRESEERFRALIDNAPEGIFVSSEGRFLFVNPATIRLLGAAAAEELLGTDVLARIAPEFHCAVHARIRLQRETGQPVPLMEQEYLRLDGSRVPVETTAVAFRYQGRDAHLVFVRDITTRRKTAADQANLQLQLQQAQKMESVGRLAGGVAHDFNNLLLVQRGYCEILKRGLRTDDPLAEGLDEIDRCAQRAAELTRQLLAFSRKQTLQPKVLDLNVLVENLNGMLQRLIGEDVHLQVDLAQEPARVMADPGQIEQVIVNLAVNARDAMPQGGRLTIELCLVELDQSHADCHLGVAPGPYVQLAVSDTGCGMDEQTRLQIFEPFFTTKGVGKGTGLGLSTVHGIVHQSGGTIWVYSEPGRGTTFKIYLPRVEAEPEPLGCPEQEIALGRGETVLVVEDDPSVRRLAVMFLETLGYRAAEAANPGDALILIEEQGHTPDLILTDVIMPGMSGRVLIERLRKTLPEVKVVYMSGYTNNAIVHHGVLDAGVDFLQKPFSLADLADRVRAAMQRT